MSGRLGNYLELVREAQNKRLEITRSQKKQIAEIYLESARDFERAAKKHSEKTLTYRWLTDYAASLKKQSSTMFGEIRGITTQSVLETAEAVTRAERRFYTKACPALSERFSDVFSRVPYGVAEELMNGRIYQGFAGLSERLWNYQREYERDIQTIINRGIIRHQSAYDLAKDLEAYLKPGAAKPWNWGIVYPGTKRVVDYNAQRLARTAVTHAYQLSLQRATQDNPFVEGYRWHSSNGGRVCPLCAARDGQVFPKDSLPLDHPNGMCVVTAEIPKSYREIGEELGAWARGENRDPALDRWLNPPEESVLNLFHTTGDFRRADGSFDLERAKEEYRKFLTTVPEKNRLYLQQSFEAVAYREHKLPGTAFGYLEKRDTIYYDISDAGFWRINFAVANTHELAHRIDSMFVNSWENAEFSKAIQDAKRIIRTDPEKFIDFCELRDKEGFLSDIMDAVCESEYKFPARHGKEYWNGTGSSGRKEKEIFANLFSLESFNDREKIEFLKTHFGEMLDAFADINP